MAERSKLTRRRFLKRTALAGAALAVTALAGGATYKLLESPKRNPLFDEYPPNHRPGPLRVVAPRAPRPNIVIVNCDDLGYGDLGCFGNQIIRTPNIDRLAAEGVRFTSFYASNSLCTPSRAGLLTGRYAQRSGLGWILLPENEPLVPRVLKNIGLMMGSLGLFDSGPNAETTGLSVSEITLAEALKSAGYRTGMVGKWHLGDFGGDPDFNPCRNGFDFFFGVPHSNDMVPYPLYRNERELEAHVEDQGKLTGLYTREAVSFIENTEARPFFLYFAHTFPHQPLHASAEFRGRSRGGLYGDTVEEIDWSLGRVMEALARKGLDRETLVFFTSDNGPWFEGNPGHQRGRKAQSYEGGFRVPMIARYPGIIPPGTVQDQPAMNIDFFPTCLALAGLELPRDRIIDGKNIVGLLSGRDRQTPHEAFYFYHMNDLEAVRMGRWKFIRRINHYVWPSPISKDDTFFGRLVRKRVKYRMPLLHDLDQDPSESYNLIDRHPGVAERLQDRIRAWESAMKRNPRGWTGQ
ncbi:MAG: sulfatase-like hydrolase/transferase [Proteobacteria bacterium]|nr:sulfatase-like hydrolase/transferase [Pseudomonadota bacterium]